MAENSFHHWLTASSINYITRITRIPLPNIGWSAFVCEACQTSTNTWVSIKCHWLACAGSYLAGNHNTTGWLYMQLTIFCDVLSTMGPKFRSFHLENFWALLQPTRTTSRLPTTLYKCLWCWQKNYLKRWKIQLAMQCEVGSLIDFK